MGLQPLIMGSVVGVEASNAKIKEHLKQDGVIIIDARAEKAFKKRTTRNTFSADAGGPMGGKAKDSVAKLKENGALPADETNFGRPIVVFCAAGPEARQVKKALENEGYKSVLNGGSLGRIEKLQQEIEEGK